MYFQAPATILEAVNMLLVGIGEQPVNAIENSGLSEAGAAQTLILGVSREIQSRGLYCNTDIDYALVRQSDDTIQVPATTLSVLIDQTEDHQCVLRGNKIYDRLNNTYTFEEDLVAAELVTLLSYEDLPDYIRELIIIKAMRKYQAFKLQDGSMHRFTQEDERRSWSVFYEKEDEHYRPDLLNDADVYRTSATRYRRIP